MADVQSFLARFKQGEKLVLYCSAAAVVLCFLPWYSFSSPFGSASANALDFTEGVVAFIAGLATLAMLVGPKMGWFKLPADKATLLPLATAGLAAVLTLYWVLFGGPGGADTGAMEAGVSAGKAFWVWLALIAFGGAAFFSFQGWKESGGSLDQLKGKPKAGGSEE